MKRQVLYVLIILSFLSFDWLEINDNSSKSSANNGENQRILDYINTENLYISDNFSQFSSYKNLIESLGVPESEKKIDLIEYNYVQLNYGNSVFILDDYDNADNIVYCKILDFNDDILFISYNGLTFNKNTRLDEFSKYFPISAKKIERKKKFKGNEEFDWIRICDSEESCENQFIFMFSNNKLRYFLYHIPE